MTQSQVFYKCIEQKEATGVQTCRQDYVTPCYFHGIQYIHLQRVPCMTPEMKPCQNRASGFLLRFVSYLLTLFLLCFVLIYLCLSTPWNPSCLLMYSIMPTSFSFRPTNSRVSSKASAPKSPSFCSSFSSSGLDSSDTLGCGSAVATFVAVLQDASLPP